VEGDILFVCFVLSFGGNLFMSCCVFFSQKKQKKERSHYEKRVFAPATRCPTTDEGCTIDSIAFITPPPSTFFLFVAAVITV